MPALSIERGFCIHCGAWKGELGLEPTPELYIEHLVMIFREVKRVLRKDGTCWLNLGDSFWGGKGQSGRKESGIQELRNNNGESLNKGYQQLGGKGITLPKDAAHSIFKPKDLLLIPHRVAIALQQDGWWVRSDIVWYKKNPMPESVTDRPSKAHEYIFLLTKSQKYYYDVEAVREENQTFINRPDKEERINIGDEYSRRDNSKTAHNIYAKNTGLLESFNIAGRNKRSVWEVTTTPFAEAHFATFPEKLVEPCVLAGTSEHGVCAECGRPYERILERERKNGKSITELQKQYRRRESEHQITPVDQPNRSSVDKVHRAESATKFDTENPTAGRLSTYRQGARAYEAKYHTNEEGLFLNASERSITIQNEREAQKLYPDDYQKQQWYINYVHEHGAVKQNRTIGWRKTCKCNCSKSKPAIVCDPFFGAGTTGLVARKGNRDFIGIELNEKYIEIAKKRLAAELEPKLL